MTWIDQLRALREQACDGPWEASGECVVVGRFQMPNSTASGDVFLFDGGQPTEENANFIVAAGNLWPLLLDAIQAAERLSASYPIPIPMPRAKWSDCDVYAQDLQDALARLRAGAGQ